MFLKSYLKDVPFFKGRCTKFIPVKNGTQNCKGLDLGPEPPGMKYDGSPQHLETKCNTYID